MISPLSCLRTNLRLGGDVPNAQNLDWGTGVSSGWGVCSTGITPSQEQPASSEMEGLNVDR